MVKQEHKRTAMGVIPKEWSVMPLRDIADFLGGGTPSKSRSEYWNGDIPWVSSSDVSLNSIHELNITRYITGQAVKESATQLCPENTILIVTRVGVGKIAIAPTKLCTSQDFTNIVLLQDNVEYVARALQPILHDMTNETQGTSIKGITTDEVKNTLITLPPIEEQKQIATVLSEMDELISLIEKKISKKKAIKQGAMQELLTGKRRLPGFAEEWETIPLRNALTVGHGMSQHDVESPIGKYPILATGGEIGKATKCLWDKPSVLIGRKGTINKPQYMDKPFWSIDTLFYTEINEGYCPKFLYYVFCQIDWLSYNEASGVPSLSARTIESIEVQMPGYAEQIAIAELLSELDFEVEVLEQKLAKYRQVKQGMMQQLLTGKIRLKSEVEDATAERISSVKAASAKPAHNHQFDDAVSIAAIVDIFYSDKYPLGRVKVQKLLYLLHRHQAVSVSDFKKKAAGPYADTVRYKGGEPIAKKNKYIVSESGKQGTRYSKGENMTQALDYVERWGMQADLQWLKENFLHTSRNDLELFATVDMAMCDLDEAGIPVSVESIKNLIASNKEWKAKLSKTYFSDWDIARAIKRCTELFN